MTTSPSPGLAETTPAAGPAPLAALLDEELLELDDDELLAPAAPTPLAPLPMAAALAAIYPSAPAAFYCIF